MMATLDGSDEPLFADDLDDYCDDDPPPLPPPIVPRPRTTPSSNTWEDREVNTSQRIERGGRGSRGGQGLRGGWSNSPSRINQSQQILGNRSRQQEDGPTDADGDKDGDTPPKKVRKPLLTFKMNRLFAENGFPYVVKEFPKLKFKGKGEEVEDLKLLLHQYEEWANAVFPKLTFPDFCKQVESMSKKTEFRTQLNSIRRESVGLDDSNDSDEESEIRQDNVITERLSPELDDSDVHQTNSTNQNEDGNSMETENNDSPVNELVEPVAATGTSNNKEFPSQWDIATEEDNDPYEDFPEL